jgi:hypothetical protein
MQRRVLRCSLESLSLSNNVRRQNWQFKLMLYEKVRFCQNSERLFNVIHNAERMTHIQYYEFQVFLMLKTTAMNFPAIRGTKTPQVQNTLRCHRALARARVEGIIDSPDISSIFTCDSEEPTRRGSTTVPIKGSGKKLSATEELS